MWGMASEEGVMFCRWVTMNGEIGAFIGERALFNKNIRNIFLFSYEN